MASVHTAHATFYMDVTYLGYNQAGNYSTYNIHLYANADSGWGVGSTASNIAWSCYGNSGVFNISGASVEIANYNVNVGHDANGYLNWTFTASIGNTGTSTYGTGVSWSTSGTAPRIPKVPSAPGITVTGNQALTVSFNITPPADNGGSAITSYVLQYSFNGGAWTGTQSGGSGARSFTNLAPGNYVFRVYAVNGVGNGIVASTGTVVVLAGGYVWNGTSWVASQGVYVWNGTAWVLCLGVFVWNGTSWVAAL